MFHSVRPKWIIGMLALLAGSVGNVRAQDDPNIVPSQDSPPSLSLSDDGGRWSDGTEAEDGTGYGYMPSTEVDESLYEPSAYFNPAPAYYGNDYSCPSYVHERCLHVLPEGVIYRSYLAGPKEPRMSAHVARIPEDTWIWGATVGARVGLLRLGNSDPIRPRGFQIDAEGAAMVRLDMEEETDVRATDYRGGVSFTLGNERLQSKFAYYHVSSHLGDEFLLKNLTFPVFGQSRDVLVMGLSYYLFDSLRLYGEAGWAFACTASEPWEFQFGVEHAPRQPTGILGAPFVAANAHLREEHDFGGGVMVHAGWAWRADTTARLFRLGFMYYNGKSTQYAFLPYHEEVIGGGMWYDF